MEEELIVRGDFKNILTNCNVQGFSIFSQTTNLKDLCDIYATIENVKMTDNLMVLRNY